MKRASPRLDAYRPNDSKLISLSGREATTMAMLVAAGHRGAAAYDFPGGPPYRLAAYIHDLRKLGFPIRREMEAHFGGFHARYFLECEVTLSNVCFADL